MGDIATRLSDFAIITNDNPRTEDEKVIIENILAGVKTNNYEVIYDRAEAIKHGIEIMQENDILFSIAGAIGRTAIVTNDILPANTNQALAIIRIPQGVINYKYLLYALNSDGIIMLHISFCIHASSIGLILGWMILRIQPSLKSPSKRLGLITFGKTINKLL